MLSREVFEQLVVEGFERIPEKFREKMKNVAVLVEDEPSEEIRKREGLSKHETLLGYYHGIPITERGAFYGMGTVYPDTITIFQKPIEEMAQGNHERIRETVADTVWHEFAHHFGMDEPEVRRRERERGIDH